MPTGMDNAYRDGYCLQVWIMSTGMKIGHNDKSCLQGSMSTGMDNKGTKIDNNFTGISVYRVG